jgi:hypothetical protein
MRRLVIAIALFFGAALGVKQLFFATSTAKPHVSAVAAAGIDVSILAIATELPVQKVDDMTAVFTDSD